MRLFGLKPKESSNLADYFETLKKDKEKSKLSQKLYHDAFKEKIEKTHLELQEHLKHYEEISD